MEYSLQILQIKLWEWRGIKEAHQQVIWKNGPDEYICGAIETADIRIKDLEEAIQKIKPGKLPVLISEEGQ